MVVMEMPKYTYVPSFIHSVFHDNHQEKIASESLRYNYFFPSETCTPYNAWR